MEVRCGFFSPCLCAITKTDYHNRHFSTLLKSIQFPSTILRVLWEKPQCLCVQGEPRTLLCAGMYVLHTACVCVWSCRKCSLAVAIKCDKNHQSSDVCVPRKKSISGLFAATSSQQLLTRGSSVQTDFESLNRKVYKMFDVPHHYFCSIALEQGDGTLNATSGVTLIYNNTK